MKKLFSIFLVSILFANIAFISLEVSAAYENTEIFTTDIIFLKQSEYDSLSQNFTTISLKEYANNGYIDDVKADNHGGWTDEGKGNDMRAFTLKGLNYFKGVPFDLVDPENNNGKAVVSLAGRGATFVPTEAEISINQKAAGLYILHCSAWNYGAGDKKGEYTLVYDDGTSATLELLEDVNIHNFWGAADYATCQNVWKGNHPTGGQENAIGLFAMSNPYPEKTIEKLYMCSTDGGAKSWLMVLGITLTDKGPYLPDMGIVDLENPSTGSWIVSDAVFEISKDSALDASNLNEKPAGKHGILKTIDDNFVFEDGRKIKFWGINLPINESLYDKNAIDKIVNDIACLGYNLVRLKFNTDSLTDEATDSAYYIVSKLKENGIYTYLALNNDENLNKYINTDLINAQKDGLKKLLGETNKYTGISLAKDTSVVMLEFMPNTSFYYLRPTVVSNVDEKNLQQLFNKYLKEKYKSTSKLKKVWDDGTATGVNEYESLEDGTIILDKYLNFNLLYSNARNLDMRKFFELIQSEYYSDMKDFVEDLGYKGLTTLNSNPNEYNYHGDAYINTKTDFVARNNIYYYNNRGDDIDKPIYFTNNYGSALCDNGLGIIGALSQYKFYGKPYVITEWNSGWVNKNYTEDYIIMASYGARQNWHPIMYSYMTKNYSEDNRMTGFYDVYNNPVSRVAQVGAVRLFNAISESKTKKTTMLNINDVYLDGHRPHYMILLNHKVSDIINQDKFDNFYKYSLSYDVDNKNHLTIKSPENALYKDDMIKVNTLTNDIYIIVDKAEAYAGQSSYEKNINLKTISLNMVNNWYTAILTSVNNKALKDETNMLLTLTASVRNKGYSFSNDYVNSPGKSPVIIQPVQGQVQIKLDGDFDVYSLNSNGERKEKISTYKNSNGYTSFYVNEYSYVNDSRSTSFEIVRK